MNDIISEIDLVTKSKLKNSVSGKTWLESEAPQREILTLIQRHQIPEIIAKILVSKGILSNEVENFLEPTIKNTLPDPFHLKDMSKAAERIANAIINNEKIAIFGDYDVDGSTSSALLGLYLEHLGTQHIIYIPDRVKEGYGPNSNAISTLIEQGCKVLITVDCGTAAHEVLEKATNQNIDVIVVDHHLGPINLPKIFAVVNPNRIDEDSEYTYLAAVGVTFLLTVAINITLKKKGTTPDKLPNLISYLDLVALGTVCDVVPLKGLNRTFVKQGLKVIEKQTNLGLTTLSNIAKINSVPSTYHLGYLLGPRINAGGRVGESILGAKLLTTKDYDFALKTALKLDEHNNERKAIELKILETCLLEAEKLQDQNKVIILSGEDWHQGVIGIIAGRIKEKFNLPVAVITLSENKGKASCRSIKGFDFGSAINNAKLEGIILEGGGHAMAAGFTIERDKIPQLQDYLNDKFSKSDGFNAPNISHYCGVISIESVTTDLAKMIESIGPFGSENIEPRFLIKDVFIHKADIFSNEHIRLVVGNSELKIGKMLNLTVFRAVGTDLGNILTSIKSGNLHIVGYLRMNYWMGKEKVDFIIEDVIKA